MDEEVLSALPFAVTPSPITLPRRSPRPRWQRPLRYWYLRLVRLRAHPDELARGLAAGVFAGLYPLFGLQTVIGVAIALRIRGNPLMAAAGTWVSNPLTYVPLYAFNYQLGRWILGRPGTATLGNEVAAYENWQAMGLEVGAALFLGCTLMGLGCSILSYGIGLPLITQLQRQYQRHRPTPVSPPQS